MRLAAFTTLTFDCYGTLIDWETGILRALRPWLTRHGVTVGDDAVLEAFAEAEAAQEAETPTLPYPAILAAVHGRLGARLGIPPDPADAEAFGRSVPDWPPFQDSPGALAYLQQHYRLVILSNVDRASFRGTNARLGVTFDAIYTAEDVGAYKPSPASFRYLLDHLALAGVEPPQILHVAESLYHDHLPAKAAGLATCWIHRRHGRVGHGATRRPDAEVRPDLRFESLGALAEAHRQERGGDRGPASRP